MTRPFPNGLRPARFLAVALALTGCAGGPTAERSDDDPEWELVWVDEFDGVALDPSRWSVQTGDGCSQDLCGWGNNELQWYQADNLEVGDGVLTITARREGVGGGQYTSARIRTRGKGDWTYGRFEISARLPEGRGLWPAIWMLPTEEVYGEWAASGEIDIMELVGHEPHRVHGTLHFGGPWPANQYRGDHFDLAGGDFSDDFHVFALEWEEGEIRWYVDGTRYQTQTEWSSTGGPYPAPFDQLFHLVLNVAVGGDWPGPPDATTSFPQTLQVDYVRVYRRP